MKGERLDKVLARLAGLTRAQAMAAVRRGRVAVDGAACREPSSKVPAGASLTLDGHALEAPPTLAVLHKPVGVQSTVGDPWGRPNLADLAPDLLAAGLHPVGRLDADTDGLLPFAAEGALTQRLLHPRHAVEKVYVATVEGEPGPELVGVMAAGVETAEGVHIAEVRGLSGPVVTLAVTEGKHRMVRRMLANAGFPVMALRRIRFGELELGELPAGAWRPATEAELAWAAGLIG